MSVMGVPIDVQAVPASDCPTLAPSEFYAPHPSPVRGEPSPVHTEALTAFTTKKSPTSPTSPSMHLDFGILNPPTCPPTLRNLDLKLNIEKCSSVPNIFFLNEEIYTVVYMPLKTTTPSPNLHLSQSPPIISNPVRRSSL